MSTVPKSEARRTESGGGFRGEVAASQMVLSLLSVKSGLSRQFTVVCCSL